MPKTILYLSHGSQKFHDQTRYSLLTLLALLLERNRNDIRIAVYTDRPDQLPAHDLIRPMRISAKELSAWRGPLDYVHRIKLKMLERALGELGAPLIYVDSDTRWLQIPDEPFDALSDSDDVLPAVYMHVAEGLISEHFHKRYFKLLCDKRQELVKWGLPPDPPWMMWNAGTIGIPSRCAGFIDEVLRMNDGLLPHCGHRNVIEQLALSVVAQSRFDIRPFDAYLEHWWHYSTELPVYLRRFFDQSPPGLPAAEEAARAAQFLIVENDLRDIQAVQANRFARWKARQRRSFYKRRIDLLAFVLRLRMRMAAAGSVD